MSNFLSPKKAPLNQETLESVLVVLRQPFSIAVVASLAVHGLLGAALPNLLSAQQQEPDTQRRVQVVELSPAEQAQLPQLGINPLPTLLPVKPSPPVKSGTKLPDPKLYNDPSFDSMPIFPLPPPNIFSPDFSNLFPPIGATPKKEPRKQAATTDKRKNPPPPPVDSGTPKEGSNKIDGKAGAPGRSPTLSPAQVAALQKDADRSRQLRALYTFKGPDTKEKATGVFKANATAFVDTANKITGGVADDSRLYNKPERENGVFPKDACPFVGGVRNASFGAIVKPDGSLAEPPTILLTSGFEGLDNAAIDDIVSMSKNKKLGESSKFQLIRFDYIFDPKAVCPNVSNPS